MTNELIANIAISVTAATLATAAVAFTASGNTPRAPRPSDLPAVTVGAPSGTHSHRPGGPSASETTAEDASTEETSGVAEEDPSGDDTPDVAGGRVPATSSSPSGITGQPPAKDDANDDHEVVPPKVHETDGSGHETPEPPDPSND